MSKKEKEEEKFVFTPEQITNFKQAFLQHENPVDFYVSAKVIRLDEHGCWVVQYFEDGYQDKITGLNLGEVPYKYFKMLEDIYNKEQSRIEYAKKKQMEYYEEQAESVGQEISHNAYNHKHEF